MKSKTFNKTLNFFSVITILFSVFLGFSLVASLVSGKQLNEDLHLKENVKKHSFQNEIVRNTKVFLD